MDFNCGALLGGECDMEEMAQRIFELMLATVSEKRSKSKELRWGDNEFVPWHIGIMS